MTSIDRARPSHAWLSTRELLVVCVSVLLVIAGGVTYRLTTGSTSPVTAAWTIGGDFVAFYMAGRILNDGQGDRLYDFQLQEQIYRELVPDATGLALPFPYPPFIAAMFRPLALLPMSIALLIFLIVSPVIFLGSLALLIRRFGPTARDERMLALVGGLSFFPFVGYTWLGAQITFIAFASVALALSEDSQGRSFTSGLALSLCLYKPTLLVLVVPMLLVTGRQRHLIGFVTGATLLILVSVAVAGIESARAFVERLLSMSASYTETGSAFANPYRFVDVNSFFRLLPYGTSIAGHVLRGVIAVTALVALVSIWVRARAMDRRGNLLVWAATLTWTSVLNVYTSAYDTILVVAAAILAVAAVCERGWQGWNRLAPALLAVYVTPWIAELSTRLIHVQVYTLALAWLGTVLLFEARRSLSSRPQTAPEVVA